MKKLFLCLCLFALDQKNLKASPGTRYKHYAPKSKLELIDTSEMLEKAEILKKNGYVIGIISTIEHGREFKEYEKICSY